MKLASVARSILLVVVIVAGCASPPVGTYRVDDAVLLAASCSGVDLDRRTTWSEALAAAPIADLQIGRARNSVGGDPQAQFIRSDSSVFFAAIQETGDRVFAGTRAEDGVTVGEALLGADYSALLEPDSIGCTFDLDVAIDLAFRDDSGFASLDGTVIVTVSETVGGENPCDLTSCEAELRVAAARTGGSNPGLAEDSAGDGE